MGYPRSVPPLIRALFVALALAGCNAPAATPIVIVVTAAAPAVPSSTPDVIATDVARQRAVAATLTAEAKAIQVSTAQPTAAPTIPPTVTRLPPTPLPTPASRLRNLQCTDDPVFGQKKVRCMVEYYYNGEWGANNIFVSATAWNDIAQLLEIYSDRRPVSPGEDVVEFELLLHDRGKYWTQRIQICMFAEGSVPRIHCQFWPYPKVWNM